MKNLCRIVYYCLIVCGFIWRHIHLEVTDKDVSSEDIVEYQSGVGGFPGSGECRTSHAMAGKMRTRSLEGWQGGEREAVLPV